MTVNGQSVTAYNDDTTDMTSWPSVRRYYKTVTDDSGTADRGLLNLSGFNYNALFIFFGKNHPGSRRTRVLDQQ